MRPRKELTKQQRIDKEIKRLRKIYKDIEAYDCEGLISEAAYMRVQLDIYRTDLDENGYVEMFSQSDKMDPYERERPVARLYATLNKNYQGIMKQLNDLLPKPQQKQPEEKSDGFDDFVNGREDV